MTTSDQTLADHIAELSGHAPAGILGTFATEQQLLDAAGLPAGIPAPGSVMPDGQLLDAHGEVTTLAQARGGRAAAVVLYRGAWCPYCNVTLRVYQQQLVPELSARDIALIAVSPQKPDGSLTMQEKHDLSFTVLSDPGNQIAGQLGVLTAPTEDVQEAQATLGVSVAESNADGTPALPMPTVVLVDPAGIIRWIDVHPNYATRTEPKEILAAVASMIS